MTFNVVTRHAAVITESLCTDTLFVHEERSHSSPATLCTRRLRLYCVVGTFHSFAAPQCQITRVDAWPTRLPKAKLNHAQLLLTLLRTLSKRYDQVVTLYTLVVILYTMPRSLDQPPSIERETV
jgi:hypothetical protein